MAEQSLTPENLESYSTEAISNFSKAIEDFADVLTEIKSEDANIAVSVSYTHLTLPTNREV